MKKILNYFLISFFLIITTKAHSNISNSVIITVGNIPITSLDLIKEMRLISILTNNQIDSINKEQIKTIAVNSLIKRKVKEIEIKKYNIEKYNKKDLNKLILNSSQNIGTNENGLRSLMENKGLKFENLKKRYEIDLKWNTLIFELYKNKVALNMSEVEDRIKLEIERTETKRRFLLSEIEINQDENSNIVLNKILNNIKNQGFEKTAKEFSVSPSSDNGGNIGWIDQKDLSKKVYENIKNLKINEISKPIKLETTLVIIKKTDEKTFDKNLEKIKNRVLMQEKEKKLQMFSNSHYSNLRNTIQINFL
tara:strand:- start:5073 stop:5996 length:924 start_codon:yes stop_codon:yes gene_type:complete